jgi:hypothetical protein
MLTVLQLLVSRGSVTADVTHAFTTTVLPEPGTATIAALVLFP